MKKTIKHIMSLILCFIFIIPVFVIDASDSIRTLMEANFSKALNYSGRRNFDGYCGTCVSYQLYAYGITRYTEAFNGNQAYSHFASSSYSSGGYKITPYHSSVYSLNTVLNLINKSTDTSVPTPLLLCFKKGTASNAGQTYGHTLLIYAVNNGYVYYADSMYPTVSESVRSLTIDDFCKHYSDYPETARTEFVFTGAILFCKTKPVGLNISTDKNRYVTGESVIFNLSAVGANKKFIGINKDGVRCVTAEAKDGYSVSFSEPGIYTAYFTASNVFGHCDSEAITFEVYSPELRDQWIGIEKTEVSVNETINMCYDAVNATGYYIGITNPDSSFTAINTYGSNTYELKFDSPGIYHVYVTCVNEYGYIDTQSVAVNVY